MNDLPKIKLPHSDYLSRSVYLSGKIVNPKRDWRILIVFFALLVLISIGFDFYVYQKIVSGDMYISVKKEELVIEDLKSDGLQKIVDDLENRKYKISTLKIENLVDPSI